MYGLKKHHIEKLEAVNKYLLRKVFPCQVSTPTEVDFMDTNTIQIHHVIMSRRLMYYWNILQMDESELVRKVYNVQKLSSCKNDWVLHYYRYARKYKKKINCSLCSGNYEETEIHLLQCEGITFEQELKNKVLNMKYSDIFASLEKHIKAIKLWTIIYKIREWKLEARKLSPVDTRSTSLSASPACDNPLDMDVDLSLLFGDSSTPPQNLSVYVCDFGY